MMDQQKDIGIPRMPQDRNHLLVIAIDKYQHIGQLNNSVKDATDVTHLLEQYSFSPENITTLFDAAATKTNIATALRRKSDAMTDRDNLVIYFSGHGYFDQLLGEGFWIPVEGKYEPDTDRTGDYLGNKRLLDYLRPCKAKHILLIVDSCFSGALLSQTKSLPESDVRKLYTCKSRWALTSGRIEPVLDGSLGGNSPFARNLIQCLNNNQEEYMMVSDLAQAVKHGVAQETPQIPNGSPLFAIDEGGGEYLFLKTGAELPGILSSAEASIAPPTVLPIPPPRPNPRSRRSLTVYSYGLVFLLLVLSCLFMSFRSPMLAKLKMPVRHIMFRMDAQSHGEFFPGLIDLPLAELQVPVGHLVREGPDMDAVANPPGAPRVFRKVQLKSLEISDSTWIEIRLIEPGVPYIMMRLEQQACRGTFLADDRMMAFGSEDGRFLEIRIRFPASMSLSARRLQVSDVNFKENSSKGKWKSSLLAPGKLTFEHGGPKDESFDQHEFIFLPESSSGDLSLQVSSEAIDVDYATRTTSVKIGARKSESANRIPTRLNANSWFPMLVMGLFALFVLDLYNRRLRFIEKFALWLIM